MKRYLRMLRYMMEDTTRYLCEENLAKYAAFIGRQFGNAVVEINGIDDVISVWSEQDYVVSLFSAIILVKRNIVMV